MTCDQIKSGFTIVEIMIVVAIIGSLAAIAIPNYYQYIARAQQNSCLAEVKGYKDNVYYTINNGTPPIAPVTGACQSITDATGWTLSTQQKIIAVAKSPSNARIECDIPNGSPCRIIP